MEQVAWTAAEVRSWALATGRAVGARGAVSAALSSEFVAEVVLPRLRRGAPVAGRWVVSVAPAVARAGVHGRRHVLRRTLRTLSG